MKIAVFGQFNPAWYGCMSEWVADGFENNGHTVDRVDRKEVILFPEQYDLIMNVDCSEDYSSHVTQCKGAVRAFWSLDAHMPGGAERSVNIAKKCDIVFSSNYEAGVKILEKFGIESHLMPITYNGYLHDFDDKKRDLDVVMIGHPNSKERLKLWELLRKYKSFTGIAKTKEEYVDAMKRAKIIVNQPTEPWDNILNNRFFEAMGCHAMLLQKRLSTRLIDKLQFGTGRHFVYWTNFKDLQQRLDYYLRWSHNAERERIATNGTTKIVQYEMKRQCAKIEAIILSKFYDRL